MNKKLLSTTFALFLLALIACGESDSEPDPFEILTGTWQELVDGSLVDQIFYFDDKGNSRRFTYDEEVGCYVEYASYFPYTDHYEGNHFRPYRLSNGERRYFANGYYLVSDDGIYLLYGGGFNSESQFFKSDLTLDYLVSYMCITT